MAQYNSKSPARNILKTYRSRKTGTSSRFNGLWSCIAWTRWLMAAPYHLAHTWPHHKGAPVYSRTMTAHLRKTVITAEQ